MIKCISYDDRFEIDELLKSREGSAPREVIMAVEDIIDRVRKGGDAALLELCTTFDGVCPPALRIDPAEADRAAAMADPGLIAAMERAWDNIWAFHEKQLYSSWSMEGPKASIMGQRVLPLARVGLYVPGGRAAYPSTVLMNAAPARVAGVKEIIMTTPPQKDGLNPAVMAAAKIAGVDRIYAVGGAQAAAAMAYGTESVPRVDKIVGPGNIYVATAKRLLYGVVDIDMIAGPSEILIIADEGADPRFIAADMMSQAEHDPLASSILLCLSERKADQVREALIEALPKMARRDIIEASLKNYGRIVVCPNIDGAIELSNAIAPEHLELMVDDPLGYLNRIENAGSIFLGESCPEPLGDYYAGPNHVLPTSGTARFFSALSVDSFLKKSSFLYYTKEALKGAAADVLKMAASEGLCAHANSISVRLERWKEEGQ